MTRLRFLRRRFLFPFLAAVAVLAMLVLPAVAAAQSLAPEAQPAVVSPTDLQALVGVGGVPVVLAFVGIAKSYVKDDRIYPALALLAGVLWNLLLAIVLQPPLPLGPAVIAGLLCGLTAAGTFSAVKTLTRTPATT